MLFALFQHLGATELVLIAWLGCIVAGAYISRAKNRPPIEGGRFGLLLGPLGLLIAAVLPTRRPA